MSSALLQDIWLCIVAATCLAYVAQILRQPLILAYIAAGIIVGPIGLKVVTDRAAIFSLAELGLAFLLFIVGLEMELGQIGTVGRRALPITVVQVAGSVALGLVAALLMGYHGFPAAYIAAAVAVSSTMVSLKLLSDRGELQTPAGHLSMGITLLQDLFAIALLAVQPTLSTEFAPGPALLALLKGMSLLAAAALISRYGLPLLFRWLSTSPEVMLLTALSWCFLVCYAAVRLDFSIALGALIAGASISAFPYAIDITAKIRGLRTFFVTIFFVALGMLLRVPTWAQVGAAVFIAAAAVASRFVTIWPMAKLLRHNARVGLLSAIYMAPISEFGVVLALVGLRYGHVDESIVTLIGMVLILTAAVTAWMIPHSQSIASRLTPRASPAAAAGGAPAVLAPDAKAAPIMLVGCFRTGSSLVHELRQAAVPFSVIDFSQDVNERLNDLGVPTVYGDISHMDTLERAGVSKARILIASITDDFLRGTDNLKLLRTLQRLNPGAKIIMAAESIEKARQLYAAGADYVILSRVLVARHLMEVIAEIGAGMLNDRREIEIEHLGRRVEVIP